MKISPMFVAAAASCLVLAYFSLRALASFTQDYSWREMDWNSDGSTSIVELLAASDTGKRSVDLLGQKCTEYFAFKDGLTVKTVCPDNSRASNGKFSWK